MDEPIYFFDTTPLYSIGENATIPQIAIAPYRYFQGADLAWMMISSALVLLMVPGIALFYSGVSNSQFALSQAWLPIMTTAVVGLEWYLRGYSIAFSNWPSSHTLWGDTDGIAFHNVLLRPVPSSKDLQADGPVIPELVYALFQGMFASFTASLVSGAAIWKDRPGHFLVFIVLWTTFVYNPIARWTWNPEGWSNKRDVLDFAGGTAVHICAGATVLAHSMYHRYLPKVEEFLESIPGSSSHPARPPTNNPNGVPAGPGEVDQPGKGDSHNVENVLLGAPTLDRMAWLQRRIRSRGEPQSSLRVYFNPSLRLRREDLDDTHGIIIFHGFGGLIGMVMTGFFARKSVARLDGFTNITGGGWDGHWAQLGWQVADALAGMGWAFTITLIILLALEPLMYFARSKRARYSKVTGDKLTDEWTMREAIEISEIPTRQAIPRSGN
ncbi:hypothetical protein H2199_003405 [Coniosporium tulheliwenetii]|uniref:Uncharacterized protein n=1 Tax=Coniosporium tulheliwenetii TaxID=3383036 RepID=A0ACC2Z9P0_9PEZI|nr:hypothetical protein H2199_003405 [Cladosporium sp. JES 115]